MPKPLTLQYTNPYVPSITVRLPIAFPRSSSALPRRRYGTSSSFAHTLQASQLF
jgi:hypothetical protein